MAGDALCRLEREFFSSTKGQRTACRLVEFNGPGCVVVTAAACAIDVDGAVVGQAEVIVIALKGPSRGRIDVDHSARAIGDGSTTHQSLIVVKPDFCFTVEIDRTGVFPCLTNRYVKLQTAFVVVTG